MNRKWEKKLVAWTPKMAKSKKYRNRRLDPDRLWHEPVEKARIRDKVRRIARKRPGALTASFLARACERVHGGQPERVKDLFKVSLPMFVSTKFPSQTPRELNEAQTVAESMEFLLRGKTARALDLLAARFIALETAAANKNDWTKAEKWELRSEISKTLANT